MADDLATEASTATEDETVAELVATAAVLPWAAAAKTEATP